MASTDQMYNRYTYVTDEKCIINANIYEYDIRACNVSVLRAYGKITEQEYQNFLMMDKQLREATIGNMERAENKTLGHSPTHNLITAGTKEAKQKLFELNNIKNENVVRIASDAVFVNVPYPLMYTTVPVGYNGSVTFKQNGPWHAMIKCNSVLVFFKRLDGAFDVVVKGINDVKVPLHASFLSFLAETVNNMERMPKNDVLRLFKEFYDSYVSLTLPIGYYREFNSNSCFRIKNSAIGSIFDIDESHRNLIDINYNLFILRDLYKTIMKY